VASLLATVIQKVQTTSK